MSTDPQQADAPDTSADIAWEVRHCAARFEDLAELMESAYSPDKAQRYLNAAANAARMAADQLEGSGS